MVPIHLVFVVGSILATASQTQLVVATGQTAPPIVRLPYGSFLGTLNETSGIAQYLGIPFAAPPVGSLRFRKPQPPLKQHGLQDVTEYKATCPQQGIILPSGIPSWSLSYSNISEDCLHINVVKPSNVASATKLPVFFWIYGGGFEIGSAVDTASAAVNLVQRSVALNEPIIFVSFNYRLNAFGFLAGEEVQAAGLSNLALRDQAMALQWAHKYIHLFGGDPARIVIGGISAGGMSVATHLLKPQAVDHENPLFRGAFMISGSVLPLAAYSEASGQRAFDQIVALTNCTSGNRGNYLDCLRRVPYDNLMVAINQTRNLFSYSSIDNDWRPRIDGDVIEEDEYRLVQKGRIYDVPLLIGTCDDEGTSFSFTTLNVTTDEEFRDYAQEYLLLNAKADAIDKAIEMYPSDPVQGSPFDTGTNNALTPQYKRFAAIQGDLIFSAPTRFLRQTLSASKARKSKIWAYLSKRGKANPFIGAAHGSDFMTWFGADGEADSYHVDSLVYFVNHLNPNAPKNSTHRFVWPDYGAQDQGALLTFSDSLNISVTQDTYRAEAIQLLNAIELSHSRV